MNQKSQGNLTKEKKNLEIILIAISHFIKKYNTMFLSIWAEEPKCLGVNLIKTVICILLSRFIMPAFEEVGIYCFANDGWSVSVSRLTT